MRVDFQQVLSRLREENRIAKEKFSQCQTFITRISTFSLSSYQLEGAAYRAWEKTLHSRIIFLKAQWNTWNALSQDNQHHITLITSLMGKGLPSVIDTDQITGRITECNRRITIINEQKNQLGIPRNNQLNDPTTSPNPLTYPDPQINLLSSNINLLTALRTSLQHQLDLFNDYQCKARSIYAQSTSQAHLLSQANTAMQAIASGQTPTMTWTTTVDTTYDSNNLKGIKAALSPAQYKALMDALIITKGRPELGSLDPKKLYSDGKINTNLWQALFHLPAQYITENMSTAAVKALENMASGQNNTNKPDITNLNKVIRWAFIRDGQKTNVTVFDRAPTDPANYVHNITLQAYGYKLSPFSLRMLSSSKALVSQQSSTKNSAEKYQWSNRAMINQMLQMLASVRTKKLNDKNSIWDWSGTGLTIKAGLGTPKKDPNAARMIVLSIQPTYTLPFSGNRLSTPDLSQYSVGFSGTANKVATLLHTLQNNPEDNDDYNFWWDLAKLSFKEAASECVGLIPGVGTGISIIQGILDVILTSNDDKNQAEAKRLQAKRLNKLAGLIDQISGNPIFNRSDTNLFGLGVTFINNPGITGEGNYTDPSHLNILIDNHKRAELLNLLKAYDRATGKYYSYNDFINAISHHFIDIFSTKKATGDTAKFLEWCRQDADLVYKHDVTDADGTVHHKGEPANRDDPPTNYRYTKAMNNDYKDFIPRSQYLAEQKAGH